jgi:hypothetical protein
MKSLSLFLAVLAVLLLISVPVSARYDITGTTINAAQIIQPGYITAFSYTCDPDEKISIIGYDIPINTVVNFTLTYGTGATVDGWIIYRPYGIAGQAYSEVSIGGNTHSETFIDPQIAGYSIIKHVEFVSYARNKTSDNTYETGFAVFQEGYPIYISNEIAFYPVDNLAQNLIYGISVSATQGTRVIIRTNKADELAEYVSATIIESTLDTIAKKANEFIAFLSAVTGIILTILWWLKFIFIDNIVITFLFYFLGTMAWDVNTAKNEFSFFAKFFRHQKMFLEFLISIVDRAWRWITRT